MESTDLRLEIVTPLFLHGQDNDKLELRPPPFKALMRYWWRATQAETNLDQLREEEGKLFGDTKRRSNLSIRISGLARLTSFQYPPLPHRPNRFQADAYRPNQTFTIKLTAPHLNQYEQISKISFFLGGLGNRSRRGFGSIRYQSRDFQSVDELREDILQTLDGLTPGNFSQSGDVIESDLPDPGYPVIKKIFFGQDVVGNNAMDSLLRKIGQATSNHANPALGSADPRMASPIHVRIQKIGDEFVIIVTQMHSHLDRTIQQNFIDALI